MNIEVSIIEGVYIKRGSTVDLLWNWDRNMECVLVIVYVGKQPKGLRQ